MKHPIMFALASAAAMALLGAAPAAAEELDREPHRISYQDLNLNSEQGARSILGRIEFAAEVVCGDRFGPMQLVERFTINRCMEETINGAVTDVNNPNVTGIYYGRRPSVTIAGR